MPSFDDMWATLDNAQAPSPAMTAAPPPDDPGPKFQDPPPPPNVDFTKYPGYQQTLQERDQLIAGQRADTKTMLGSMQEDLNNRPAPPQLEKTPEPPQQQFGKGMQEYMMIAALMGALAGGRGRANSTAALNAFAGAVQGFHNGQKEQVQQNLKEWEAKSKQVAADNQAKLDQYNLIWKDKQLSMDQKMGMFRIAAEQWKDEMVYNTAKRGDYETLAAILEKQWGVQTQYVKSQNQLQAEIEKLKQNAIAQNQRGSTEKMMVLQWQQQFQQQNGRPPTEEETQTKLASIRDQMAYSRTAGGYGARVEAASNELEQAIPLAQEASANLPRGKFVAWNKLMQMKQSALSDPMYHDFIVKALAVKNAYVRAMNPTGSPRIAEREELKADQILSSAISPEAFDVQLAALWSEVQRSKVAISKARAGSENDPNYEPKPYPSPATGGATSEKHPGWSVVPQQTDSSPQLGTGL